MMAQDRMAANVGKALGDFRDQAGESWFERNVANPAASLAGFNQMDPTRPGFSKPGMPGMTGRANWGWDPAGLAGSIAGGALGAPVGGGLIADLISRGLGRPFEQNLGPDVFGGSSPAGISTAGGQRGPATAVASKQGGTGAGQRSAGAGTTRTPQATGQAAQAAVQQAAQKAAAAPVGGNIGTFNPYPGAMPPGLGGQVKMPSAYYKQGVTPVPAGQIPKIPKVPNYFMDQMV